MSPTNTATLKIAAADLLVLAGRLFEAELNGTAADRAHIVARIAEEIRLITSWAKDEAHVTLREAA